MKRRHMPAGFTLIELLVVIFLIGLVMMLLIPQRRGAREAARRASCSVKMKNLATALHLYQDNFQRFPPSAFYHDGEHLGEKNIGLKTVVPGHDGISATRAPYSYVVKIFPYFGSSDLYDKIDFKNDEAFAAANYQLAARVIPVLSCPSFRGNTFSSALDYAPPAGVVKPALTNYKTLGATTLACLQNSASVMRGDLNGGILHPYATYDFKMLVGANQTAILVETKEAKYAAWWDGTTASIPGFHPGLGNVEDDRIPSPPLGVPALNLDASGAQKSFITTSQFGGREDMQWGPSSEHPGLVMHAMGGTETRAINSEIDPVIYRALISRRADDNGDIGERLK